MSFNSQYESIRQGLRAGETHASFVASAADTIVRASAHELWMLLDYEPDINTIHGALEESKHKYFIPIGAHLDSGMLTNSLKSPVYKKPLSDHITNTPSNLAKIELPRLAEATQANTNLPINEVILRVPNSWIEKFTLDTLGIKPPKTIKLDPEIMVKAANEKMIGYEQDYIHAALGLLSRMTQSDEGGISVKTQADRLLKTATLHANMMWQLRQVFKYIGDSITEPSNNAKLLNIQFASFSDMTTNVFQAKKDKGIDYALSWTKFTIAQDILECAPASDWVK